MFKKSGIFSVIESLKIRSASETSRVLKIPKRSLMRIVKNLKSLGIIEKVGYGTWNINNDNLFKLYNTEYTKHDAKMGEHGSINTPHPSKKSGILSSDSFRSHDFQFRLRIKGLNKWDNVNRCKFLNSEGIKFVNIKQGQKLFIDGFRIWLTNISVLVWVPMSFFVDDPNDGYNYGIFEFLKIVSKLESLLRVSFKIMGKYEFKLCRQHQALIKNALARQYNREKKKLYVFDDRGNWLLVDNSDNLDECEVIGCRGVDGVESRNDSKVIQQFFNELKEVALMPKTILKMVHGVTMNQEMYNKNFKSHIGVIKDLGFAVSKLTKTVENLRDSK